jgi:hypothetical protein
MKRIAIIENGFAHDTQIFSADPGIIEKDPHWEDHFTDVKYPCQYAGIFEGESEDEIRAKAAASEGVHPDIISLISFEQTADSGTTAKGYVCPVCENEEHPPGARFCKICGNEIAVRQGADKTAAPDTDIINKVFYPGSDVPLTPKQLADEAGPPLRESDYLPSRISGRHCDCKSGGEFELLPKDHPDVVAGEKRYMQCRICGGWSHL